MTEIFGNTEPNFRQNRTELSPAPSASCRDLGVDGWPIHKIVNEDTRNSEIEYKSAVILGMYSKRSELEIRVRMAVLCTPNQSFEPRKSDVVSEKVPFQVPVSGIRV